MAQTSDGMCFKLIQVFIRTDSLTSVIIEEHLTFLLMYLLNLSLSFHVDYNLGLHFIIHP